MHDYQSDTTTICGVCQTAGNAGYIYWFRGQLYTVCTKHDIREVWKVGDKTIEDGSPLTICDGTCPNSTLKCRWPVSKTATAESVVSIDN
jgi:hypothetical protein